MPDVAAYPLLRSRRKRRWRLPRPTRLQSRLGAVFGLALLLIGTILWASRPKPDVGKAIADSQTTLAAGNYNAARRKALGSRGADEVLVRRFEQIRAEDLRVDADEED